MNTKHSVFLRIVRFAVVIVALGACSVQSAPLHAAIVLNKIASTKKPIRTCRGGDMSYKNMSIARDYYMAMKEKDIQGMKKCLHQDVRLISPLATVDGKKAALVAARKLFSVLNTLTIREEFGSENHVMLALDLVFAAPIGSLAVASLVTFKEGEIIQIELFYDARKLAAKKDEIYSQDKG